MEYGIRHITLFRYHAPVSETVMEIRLHPRTEGVQRCQSFTLRIQPEARGFAHQDYLGNIIDSFDIPVSHSELMITAEASVELTPPPALPDALDPAAWAALDAEVAQGDFWEALMPSASPVRRRCCLSWPAIGISAGGVIRCRCCGRSTRASTRRSNTSRKAPASTRPPTMR